MEEEREEELDGWLMVVVEESGGDYRRYLKKDCNRSDILHQPVKGKKNTGGGRIWHRNARPVHNPGPDSFFFDPRSAKHARYLTRYLTTTKMLLLPAYIHTYILHTYTTHIYIHTCMYAQADRCF